MFNNVAQGVQSLKRVELSNSMDVNDWSFQEKQQ